MPLPARGGRNTLDWVAGLHIGLGGRIHWNTHHTTQDVVTKAMETVPTKKVTEWIKDKLGQSLQSKRNIAFSSNPKTEQKRDQLLNSI